jgi:hypothetical protein
LPGTGLWTLSFFLRISSSPARMSPNELDINPIISIIILLLNDANAASVMDHVFGALSRKRYKC